MRPMTRRFAMFLALAMTDDLIFGGVDVLADMGGTHRFAAPES